MAKIKRVRTIDAVVMGWRPGKEEGTVGSLILGLYDDDGEAARRRPHLRLQARSEKRELPAELAPYETGERGMGDPSRWDNDRELEWIELRPELVVEVTFDHTRNDRIRHGTKIVALARGQGPARVPDGAARELSSGSAVDRGGRRAGAAARLHALAARAATPAGGRSARARRTAPRGARCPSPRAGRARPAASCPAGESSYSTRAGTRA